MICLLLLDVKSRADIHGLPMERFYKYFRITRQGFTKKLIKFRIKEELIKALTKEIVAYRSKTDRRAGSRSLYHNLEIKTKYGIGITKFENLVSEAGLSLAPMRIQVVTTQSCYQSWNYNNLINGLILNDINQVIVGDITYLYIFRSRYYLFCLTDIFSNRIVGFCLSKRMRTKEALQALRQFENLRTKTNIKNCIHHTDGGKQYFSKDYLDLTSHLEMQNSVARTCLENGYAEQRNGLFKHHLLPTMSLAKESKLQKELSSSIYKYNNKRKQQKLGWVSPSEFERKLKSTKYNPLLKLHDHVKNERSERIGF